MPNAPDTTILETLRVECQATPEREAYWAERRRHAQLATLEDRMSVNVGAAILVAEPQPTGEVALFIKRGDGTLFSKRRLASLPEEALNLIDAAKAAHFDTPDRADAWLWGRWMDELSATVNRLAA
ncbi:hypothetical protein D3877_11835 [Azospirillum cavernae]|uniref:Uncharacterized protein n=1 Tax=Azospirillum cavernae TaxID=2320860 RepID=A0A418VUV3_9PROT|nr:hypothetical protein [Azospirillum cavernae]RJF80920.1 hypothetical protein D3877_11835 [Azospirillum cavernae]